jgi:hypothetical protein
MKLRDTINLSFHMSKWNDYSLRLFFSFRVAVTVFSLEFVRSTAVKAQQKRLLYSRAELVSRFPVASSIRSTPQVIRFHFLAFRPVDWTCRHACHKLAVCLLRQGPT